jgi:hypothetical protein
VNCVGADEEVYERQSKGSVVTSIRDLTLAIWGFAYALGPWLIVRMQNSTGLYRVLLHVIAAFITMSTMVPFIASPPQPSETGHKAEPGKLRTA